jgi:rhodanese-related sulfurtransferase
MGVLFVFCQNASAATDYSAKELKQLIGSGEPILLLNPLSEIEFNEAHIPGSVNIPVEMIMRTKKLPKKKDMLIVTYCKGPK